VVLPVLKLAVPNAGPEEDESLAEYGDLLIGVEIFDYNKAGCCLDEETNHAEEIKAYERSIPDHKLAARELLLASNQLPLVLIHIDELVSLAQPLLYQHDVRHAEA